MNITYAPNNILQIDDARVIFRNFSGTPGKFNREGDRNFAVPIPNDEMAQELINRGWNVIVKPPREEGEEPFRYLKVKIKFNEHGPAVYLETNHVRNKLDEETVGVLDNIDILSVSLDLRPYNWNINGDSGRTAYLQAMCVVQKVDRFESDELDREYNNIDDIYLLRRMLESFENNAECIDTDNNINDINELRMLLGRFRPDGCLRSNEAIMNMINALRRMLDKFVKDGGRLKSNIAILNVISALRSMLDIFVKEELHDYEVIC